MDTPPKALVLSGGGLTCLTFTGCLRRLEVRHPGVMQSIDLYVGCSAGALLAFLFAMGMSPSAARDWCYTRMFSLSANELDLDGVFDLSTRLGIDDGSLMDVLIAEALALWGLTDSLTFRELEASGRAKELVVCVANVTRGRREFMSARSSPRLRVSVALRMSMAIPLLYTPVLYRGAVYVDGGLVDGCPVDHWFDRVGTAPVLPSSPLSPVLVLDLVLSNDRTTYASGTLPSLGEYIKNLFSTSIGSAARRTRRCGARARSHGDLVHLVIPPLVGHPFFSPASLSFEMTTATVQALDDSGYAAMDALFK